MSKKLYVDLDGVLADFEYGMELLLGIKLSDVAHDKEAFNEVKKKFAEVDFFKKLPLMKDAMELWKGIECYNPIILTAVGKNNSAIHAAHKKEWVEHFFGPWVKFKWVNRAWEKHEYADEDSFLIDDRSKSLDPFIAAGGNGVLHRNAADSIKAVDAWYAK